MWKWAKSDRFLNNASKYSECARNKILCPKKRRSWSSLLLVSSLVVFVSLILVRVFVSSFVIL